MLDRKERQRFKKKRTASVTRKAFPSAVSPAVRVRSDERKLLDRRRLERQPPAFVLQQHLALQRALQCQLPLTRSSSTICS